MSITAKQAEALQKIQDNPGRIVVFTNNPGLSWDQRIHGTVSNALYSRGYIEGYNPETGRSYHEEDNGDASLWYSGKYFMRLTPAGREALGVFANLSPTAQAVAEASVIRDQAMMVAYKAEGTSREAEADAEYEKADDAYHAAQVAHRAARIAAGDDVKPITPRPARKVEPEPFTFEYDALTGSIVADALREKAKAHRAAAKGYRTNAELGTGLQDFYAEQARIADNNAKLLEDAADAIHAPVKTSLANEMSHAIERTEVKEQKAKRERSGMDSLRESLRLY